MFNTNMGPLLPFFGAFHCLAMPCCILKRTVFLIRWFRPVDGEKFTSQNLDFGPPKFVEATPHLAKQSEHS